MGHLAKELRERGHDKPADLLIESPNGHEARVEPSGIETAVDGFGLVQVAASTEPRPDAPPSHCPSAGVPRT